MTKNLIFFFLDFWINSSDFKNDINGYNQVKISNMFLASYGKFVTNFTKKYEIRCIFTLQFNIRKPPKWTYH